MQCAKHACHGGVRVCTRGHVLMYMRSVLGSQLWRPFEPINLELLERVSRVQAGDIKRWTYAQRLEEPLVLAGCVPLL